MHRSGGIAGGVVATASLAAVLALAAAASQSAVAGTGAGFDTVAATNAGSAFRLPPDGTAVEPDAVVIEIQLRPDGPARWHVRYRVRLRDRNDTAAFASVREDVEGNRLEYAGTFRRRLQPAVGIAEDATGREMELRNVTVAADRRQPPGLPGTYGVIAYEFEWAGFAAVDDRRLRAGDALVDLFLREDVTMLVSWPDRYRMVDAVPASDEDRDGAVVWTGPKEFTSDAPRVVVERPAVSAGSPVPVSPAWLAAAVVLSIVLAIGWYRVRGPATGDGSDGEPVPPDDRRSATDDTIPVELLSDEERVVRLLEENGGRMRQQEVVDALDWSETKTSQVVLELHEAEKIERYRLGRENVLALPGEIDV